MMNNRQRTGLDAIGRNPQADMIGNEIARFAEYVRTFQGNPQQMLMQVLQSGQISQQDLNQFQQIRDAIAPILGSINRK
jgi:hypothetical protein